MLLATTCFVIWSAATAATATIARPIHWRRSADSERSATEMARNASVRSTGRMATRRSMGSVSPARRGACRRCRAWPREAPPGAAPRSPGRSPRSARRCPRRSSSARRRLPPAPASRSPPACSRSRGRRSRSRSRPGGCRARTPPPRPGASLRARSAGSRSQRSRGCARPRGGCGTSRRRRSRGSLEPPVGLLGAEAAELDDLVACRGAGHERELGGSDAKPLGEQLEEGVVCASALGRRGYADLPGLALSADELGPPGSGRNADAEARGRLGHSETQYRQGFLRRLASLRAVLGRRQLGIVDRVQRRREQRTDATGGDKQDLPLAPGVVRDGACLAVGFLDDRAGLAPRVVAHVLRRALGREQRRAHELLDLAVAGDLTLELVDTVGEVHALLPYGLVARGDLRKHGVDGAPAIAEQAPSE